MDAQEFIKELDATFFTGVPDSQLKPLCEYFMNTYGISNEHMIAANEGSAVALAAGYHLATKKIPLVYMQNSGIGNIVNPVVSLLNEKVYGIPCIFIVGWRGEPGVHDEPQHIFQGEITISLLENIGIHTCVIDADTTIDEFKNIYRELKKFLDKNQSIAFIIRKGALSYSKHILYKNTYFMNREDIIKDIVNTADDDIIVSTTGKASRELFEIREQKGQSHQTDFLTVGSMGHSSSIALEIALQKNEKKVWCVDGDGAALMHMGAMAVIGKNKPQNLIHILINNEAHETVGGMPTAADSINFTAIAKACGYSKTVCVDNRQNLLEELSNAKQSNELYFIEVKCSIHSRADLGRPTISALENKINFMNFLNSEKSTAEKEMI